MNNITDSTSSHKILIFILFKFLESHFSLKQQHLYIYCIYIYLFNTFYFNSNTKVFGQLMSICNLLFGSQ